MPNSTTTYVGNSNTGKATPHTSPPKTMDTSPVPSQRFENKPANGGRCATVTGQPGSPGTPRSY